MKKTLLSLLIVLFNISVTGQQMTKQDYLRKSRNQKTMAWILTAGGGALVLGGLISYAAESDDSYYPGKTVGTILMGSGAVSIAGGVVLFSASKRNEIKANEMAVALHLKFEKAELYRYKRPVKNYYPALSLLISLK